MEHADGIAARRRRRVRLLPYLLLVPALAMLGLMLGYPIVRLVDDVVPGVRPEAAVRGAGRLGRVRQFPRRSSATTSSGRCCAARSCSAPSTSALTMVLGMAIAMLLTRLGGEHAGC